jgi:type III secretion protein N (ATPase)
MFQPAFLRSRGRVTRVEGSLLVAELPCARIGDGVTIGDAVTGEVQSVAVGSVRIAPHGELMGIRHGTRVKVDGSVQRLALGACALGRAIDARGMPMDGGAPLRGRNVALGIAAPNARAAISQPFWTGICAVDALLTIGKGARIGLFGAPGLGKSTLLDLCACGSAADAVVVALVGERGREARHWIDRLDRRATIVCATSDRHAAERVRAVTVALSHANALRERGLDVLVLLDSLARTAGALRELAVANGETPGRGGFPPSVFATLARIVETCGATFNGSITLIATVLDDGDERDPISDAARSLLDGHVQLSEKLARAGRFPAIDIPASASRTMNDVVDDQHRHAAQAVRKALALLARTEDARTLGVAAPDPALQRAVACERALEQLLRQENEPHDPQASRATLLELAAQLEL